MLGDPHCPKCAGKGQFIIQDPNNPTGTVAVVCTEKPSPPYVLGDVVYLKTGSLPMQVTFCAAPTPERPGGEVGVVWCTPDGYGHFINGIPLICVTKEPTTWEKPLPTINDPSTLAFADHTSGSKNTRTKN